MYPYRRSKSRRPNLDPSGFGYFAAGAVAGALALHGSQRASSGPRPLDYSYEGWQASFPGSEIPGSPAQKALKAFWKYWQANGEQVADLDTAIRAAAFDLGYANKRLTTAPSLLTMAQYLGIDVQSRWEEGQEEAAAEEPQDWEAFKAAKSRTNRGYRHNGPLRRFGLVDSTGRLTPQGHFRGLEEQAPAPVRASQRPYDYATREAQEVARQEALQAAQEARRAAQAALVIPPGDHSNPNVTTTAWTVYQRDDRGLASQEVRYEVPISRREVLGVFVGEVDSMLAHAHDYSRGILPLWVPLTIAVPHRSNKGHVRPNYR